MRSAAENHRDGGRSLYQSTPFRRRLAHQRLEILRHFTIGKQHTESSTALFGLLNQRARISDGLLQLVRRALGRREGLLPSFDCALGFFNDPANFLGGIRERSACFLQIRQGGVQVRDRGLLENVAIQFLRNFVDVPNRFFEYRKQKGRRTFEVMPPIPDSPFPWTTAPG